MIHIYNWKTNHSAEDAIMTGPRFTVNAKILDNVMGITRFLTRENVHRNGRVAPYLRRVNRLRSLHSSLAIEGNRLSLDEVSAIIDGKAVRGPKDEIAEVRNAHTVYEMMDSLDPFSKEHLLQAHGLMMKDLVKGAGSFRTGDEGVFDSEGNCIHLAPGPELVPKLMGDLLEWTRTSDYNMIVKSCVFHYGLEYIHPFEDGNGRMGRFWQTLLLSKFDGMFRWIPVESVIRTQQKEYYDAIEQSNESFDCTAFLEYMTGAILKALGESEASSVAEESGTDGLRSNEVALYAMIRDGYYRDVTQAAVQMGVSRATINRCLKILRDKGLIVKEGNQKSGVWKIADMHIQTDSDSKY